MTLITMRPDVTTYVGLIGSKSLKINVRCLQNRLCSLGCHLVNYFPKCAPVWRIYPPKSIKCIALILSVVCGVTITIVPPLLVEAAIRHLAIK